MKKISLSISYTSRSKRLNEIDGKIIFLFLKSKFTDLKNKNYFIETSNNFKNLYGSPYKNIILANKSKENLLFDIDWKGARKIRNKFNKSSIIDFFLLPPSKKELKKLIKRGRDNKNEINLRLSYALNEMKHYKEYKYVLVNENVHKTVNEIKKIIEFSDFMESNNKNLEQKLKRIIYS